jgi:hypothetical protein
MTTMGKILGWLTLFTVVLGFIVATKYLGLETSIVDHSNASSCSDRPVFSVEYKRESNAAKVLRTGIDFQGVSIVGAYTCSSGKISISGSGNVVDQEAPTLTVSLNNNHVADINFDKQITQTVKLNGSGHLTLSYLNDYYLSEFRALILRDFIFKGEQCRSFNVSDENKSNGIWNSSQNSATLIYSAPLILFPCSSGILELQVFGRSGAGKYPSMSAYQNNKTIGHIKSGKNGIVVKLKVDINPIQIKIDDPYAKVVKDRNMYLDRIVFEPSSQ